MKDWQKGYDLDLLRTLATRFQEHDGPRPLGAFSKVKENNVALWLEAGHLIGDADSPALVVARWAKAGSTISDFRGHAVTHAPAGTLIVSHVAGPGAAVASTIRALDASRIVWRRWADHFEEHLASNLLGLRKAGTTISASSEIRSIDVRSLPILSTPRPSDLAGIVRLNLDAVSLTDEDRTDLDDWPSIIADRWNDHYSSYNKRRSWHAVALRSFGGDETFIEKPSEMSKRWKTEHPETLTAPILDTPLYDLLPGARRILDRFPCSFERVRLMRLTSTGELSRHADITDREAGTDDGQIARLHIPLTTDPSVEFTTWDIEDSPTTVHMNRHQWWYLDVRKPHRAINPSGHDRIHLVADAIVTPQIREAIS